MSGRFRNNNVMLSDLAERKDSISVRLMDFYAKNFWVGEAPEETEEA